MSFILNISVVLDNHQKTKLSQDRLMHSDRSNTPTFNANSEIKNQMNFKDDENKTL